MYYINLRADDKEQKEWMRTLAIIYEARVQPDTDTENERYDTRKGPLKSCARVHYLHASFTFKIREPNEIFQFQWKSSSLMVFSSGSKMKHETSLWTFDFL